MKKRQKDRQITRDRKTEREIEREREREKERKRERDAVLIWTSFDYWQALKRMALKRYFFTIPYFLRGTALKCDEMGLTL